MTNQLLAEAETLPDLDEFSGLSIKDIAASIAYWEDGTEDQNRALAALRSRAPGIGHNRPPVSERLDDEFAALKRQAAELVEIAKTAVIIDDESAAKVSVLVKKMSDLSGTNGAVEELRKRLQKPYTDAVELIRSRAHEIADPVRIALGGMPEDRGRGGLRRMLTAWDDKKEAEAEAERERAREEQRKREAEAAAARQAAEEAAAAGKSTVGAEITALAAEDAAERAAHRAEAIRPEPIRSHAGVVSRTREITFRIVEDPKGKGLRDAIGWILRQTGGRSAAQQFAQTWIGKYLRGLGVDTVDRGGVEIPGVEVSVVKGSASVRR